MFVLSAPYVKTVAEWKALSPRRSVRAAATRYARQNMAAVVMCGDDGAVTYLYDAANDRVSIKAYKHVEWVS